MLKPLFRKEITREDIGSIYSSKIRPESQNVMSDLRRTIRDIRFKHRAVGLDPLAEKQRRYADAKTGKTSGEWIKDERQRLQAQKIGRFRQLKIKCEGRVFRAYSKFVHHMLDDAKLPKILEELSIVAYSAAKELKQAMPASEPVKTQSLADVARRLTSEE